jgi:hypothetical protein
MLYASLATSFFSAFLAMLGKQWLNRYASTDMRGSGIERSQDRQRKLNGIVTWYFDYVMESLPLMLQFALLLFGCALSLYLRGICMVVAGVVFGVTALGVFLYAFVVVAGAASVSCPYQTPCARILRHIYYQILRHIYYQILPPILCLLRSAFCDLVYRSSFLALFSDDFWDNSHPGQRGWVETIPMLLRCIIIFPLLLVSDAYQLAWEMVRALTWTMARVLTWVMIGMPTALAHRAPGVFHWVCGWIDSAPSAQARRLNQRMAALDSQCISWILQTSLETGVRLSTLEFLATTPTLANFTPTLLSDCFNILTDCIKVNNGNPVIVQGMEQLAEASATCFFLTYSHLLIMDPTPSILVDVRQRYRRIFPPNLTFCGLPFRHIFIPIREAIYQDRGPGIRIKWWDYPPTNHKHITFAHALSKLSLSQRRKLNETPPSCFSFATHYLSQDPLPPPSIIADCLLIITIDWGCNVPNTMVMGERYVDVWHISTTLLIKNQCTTRGSIRPDNSGTPVSTVPVEV